MWIHQCGILQRCAQAYGSFECGNVDVAEVVDIVSADNLVEIVQRFSISLEDYVRSCGPQLQRIGYVSGCG